MSSGVVKLSVPIPSSLPQRPQFLQRSAAFLTSFRVSLRLRFSRVSTVFGALAALLVVFFAVRALAWAMRESFRELFRGCGERQSYRGITGASPGRGACNGLTAWQE